jgi:hypothetical protein
MPEDTHSNREPTAVPEEGEKLYTELKPSMDDLLVSLGQLNRTSVEFLKTDVDTALTFASIALQTEDLVKRQRNCGNARKGFDTIARLATRVKLSEEDTRYLSEKMTRLKLELLRLGEKF